MQLPIYQTGDKNLTLLQNRWASILNPLLSNALSSSIRLTGVKLNVGANTINHLLQRDLQGYIITGMRGGFAQVYQIESQSPQLYLILNSNASVVVDLVVF